MAAITSPRTSQRAPEEYATNWRVAGALAGLLLIAGALPLTSRFWLPYVTSDPSPQVESIPSSGSSRTYFVFDSADQTPLPEIQFEPFTYWVNDEVITTPRTVPDRPSGRKPDRTLRGLSMPAESSLPHVNPADDADEPANIKPHSKSPHEEQLDSDPREDPFDLVDDLQHLHPLSTQCRLPDDTGCWY